MIKSTNQIKYYFFGLIVIHLPMKLCDREGIWKTQLYTDSLSPKIKPCIITCQILHESSVARFPTNKFS